MKRSYAIIGAGAVGGYYGAQLQLAGFDVHYLFHNDYDSVLEKGLLLLLKENEIYLPEINAYNDVKNMPCCDVILIALKTTKNNELEKLLIPLLKENSVIVIMQNGLGNEEKISSVTDRPILCGLPTLGVIKLEPGVLKVTHDGIVKLAAYRRTDIENTAIKMIADDFYLAKLPFQLYDNYLRIRWEKLLWNMPFNGLSVIFNTTVDELAKHSAPLLKEIAAEIITIAAAYNVSISMRYFEELILATQSLTGYKTSMRNDYERKLPLEIEYIYGHPLKAANKKAINCPKLEELYQKLITLDLNNRQ